ncbi:putative p-loop containing nucleoside triphosphate hydrolase [Golovinomyces cichoracearum]|uniref:Putative p-loop containing nucleoside triphosphate hydrolase n=1 Tax=Golovinomyces cichoracearum TaxID=62708 RepID=A0A420IM15_9PEZI|nr:putative p-loop containing nucleoside triphosphate hydrolase [Golovinomyces cichoracearum]
MRRISSKSQALLHSKSGSNITPTIRCVSFSSGELARRPAYTKILYTARTYTAESSENSRVKQSLASNCNQCLYIIFLLHRGQASGFSRDHINLALDFAFIANESTKDTSQQRFSQDQYSKRRRDSKSNQNDESSNLFSKMLEEAATTFATALVLGTGFGLGGYIYHKSYKWLVLEKMKGAFTSGDPALEIASMSKYKSTGSDLNLEPNPEDHWILRDEQAKINSIVDGSETGHYHLLIGEKGTGKSSLLLDAMRIINGEGCSMFEAHSDIEIFRIRLGKALDFEFHEDYIGSYFSVRGPRDSTALLDIERALNKLEKLALKRKKRGEKPLVLIINSVHLLRDNDDGQSLLELLQQKAETWAASHLVTLVFNSDDYWVYERLKHLASRMEVTAITDLPKSKALSALAKYRHKYFQRTPSTSILEEVYNRIGGRLIYLNRVARAEDMLKVCDEIIETERRWFLNQAWILGSEMDDDVMDQQKHASAAMVLAQALVKAEDNLSTSNSESLPEIPLHIARQIMTRGDFIKDYDHKNLFTITSTAKVRADSVPMQIAFRSICKEPGFDEHLEKTLQRIADIESLGRTREIVAKDLLLGFKYKISPTDSASRDKNGWEVIIEEKTASEDNGDSK